MQTKWTFSPLRGVVAVLVSAMPAFPGTVVSVGGPNDDSLGIFSNNAACGGCTQAPAMPFTIGHAYSAITVSAELTGSFPGTAYITDQIGSGTTDANVIATGSFTSTGSTVLFQNLTLAAGTYYLVIGTATNGTLGAGIEASMASDAVITTDVGASVARSLVGSCGGPSSPCNGFYPAYGFNVNSSILPDLHYSVSTPEPSAWVMIGLGIGLLSIWSRVVGRGGHVPEAVRRH